MNIDTSKRAVQVLRAAILNQAYITSSSAIFEKHWGADFILKQIHEIGKNLPGLSNRVPLEKITLNELNELSRDELEFFNFHFWSGGNRNYFLIPVYALFYLDREVLEYSSRGKDFIRDPSTIDIRAGCSTVGIMLNPRN